MKRTGIIAMTLLMLLALPRESSALGLFSFLSDLFGGLGRLVSLGGEAEGKASSLSYVKGRRLLRDDFHLAHGGPMVESVERAVSTKELLSILNNRVLMRPGRPKVDSKLYVTNRVPFTQAAAARVLALRKKPNYAVQLVVPKSRFSTATPIAPVKRWVMPTLPGGGIERTAPGQAIVPTTVTRIRQLPK